MRTPRSKDALDAVDVEPVAHTVAEVAAAMRVSYDTALRLVKARKIPSFKVGSQYRVPRAHLVDVLRQASETGADLLSA